MLIEISTAGSSLQKDHLVSEGVKGGKTKNRDGEKEENIYFLCIACIVFALYKCFCISLDKIVLRKAVSEFSY